MIKKHRDIWESFLRKIINDEKLSIPSWFIADQESEKFVQLDRMNFVLSEKRINLPKHEEYEFGYISNPDGSPRWIFPANLKFPGYLSFYNSPSLKARLYKIALKLAYTTGIQKLFYSGTVYLYAKAQVKMQELSKVSGAENFSLFTGTTGPYRKFIVAFHKEKESISFLKIPVGKDSSEGLRNEKDQMQFINKLTLDQTVIPELKDIKGTEDGLMMSGLGNNTYLPKEEIPSIVEKSLFELSASTCLDLELGETKYYKDLCSNIEQVNSPDGFTMISRLKTLLEAFVKELNPNQQIPVCFAHGDFTPWNIIFQKEKLGLIDFEHASIEYPVLYDYLNFIVQKAVLVDHLTYKEILTKLMALINGDTIQGMIRKYNIDIQLHLSLYFAGMAARYLKIFNDQDKLHKQAYWQMEIWIHAMSDILSKQKTDPRQEFLADYFSLINNYDYLWLKSRERISSVREDSDFDLLVRKKDIKDLIKKLSDHPSAARVLVHNYYNRNAVSVTLKDDGLLHFDFIHQFSRKSVKFVSIQEMFAFFSKTEEGIKTPFFVKDFEYSFLFYVLNGAALAQKHISKLSENAKDKEIIRLYINKKYGINLKNLEELNSYDPQIYKKVLGYLLKQSFNSVGKRLLRLAAYVLDTVKHAISGRGIIITFSGVDGAGKTTVINQIVKLIDKKYRKPVVVLRHRPSVLPILSAWKYGKLEAEKRTTEVLPRSGDNQSMLSSLFRFGYYYIDYLFGQFYVWFRYLLRGYVVVYDRYYFDFINDSQRSNIKLNNSLIRSLYSLVWKPRFSFFLYEYAHVILKRKKELDAGTIEELNEKYLNLFDELEESYPSGNYIALRNSELKATLCFIDEKLSSTLTF